MNLKEFIKLLNKSRELIGLEKYVEANAILENLKEIEKNGESDFNYNLVHQLYQLDSNCKSAHHQQVILEIIKDIPTGNNSISFEELSNKLKLKENLYISEEILRREVEILILRNLLSCKIEKNKLIFSHH